MTHRALIYDTDDEFVDAVGGFLREGVEAEETALAVVRPARAGMLREGLGDAARSVEFHDASEWYVRPATTLHAYDRYLRRQPAGTRTRVIGEALWYWLSEPAVREWTRYEALLNVVFADSPVSILCGYDARMLPATAANDARHTHPELLQGVTPAWSDAFTEPVSFCTGLDMEPLDPPVEPLSRHPLRSTEDLGRLRQAIAQRSEAVGLDGRRRLELVVAVNEVATNVLRHAGTAGVARIWTAGEHILCEVADFGPGIEDPLTGHLPPHPDAVTGWGLWLSRHMCELVQVRSDESGTVVRLQSSTA